MLCDVYVLRGGICTTGEIGNYGDQFLWFPYFWDVGCTEVGAGNFLLYYHGDWFLGFLGFLCLLEKQSLDRGRVVAKESHSFIW